MGSDCPGRYPYSLNRSHRGFPGGWTGLSYSTTLLAQTEVFTGQVEDLPLRLVNAGAPHLLVLAQDADYVCLVFLDGRSEFRGDVLRRVDLQGVLGLARRE